MNLPLSQQGLIAFLALIAGVGAASFLDVSPRWLFGAMLFGVLVLVFGLLRSRAIAAFCGCIIVLFLFGIARIKWEERSIPPSDLSGQTITIEAVVADFKEQGTRGTIIAEGAFRGRTLRLQGTVTRNYRFLRGEHILLSGVLLPIETQSIIQRNFLYRDGVDFVLGKAAAKPLETQPLSFVRLLDQAKFRFEAGIERALPAAQAAYVLGVLLGDRRDLSAEIKEEFSRTGTSHLIALSGFNITIIAVAIAWVFGLFHASQRTKLVGSTLGIALFVIAVGAGASVVRAAVMGVLALIARERGRIYDMTNALLFAAVLMILINPYLLRFDLSFQLSFLATLGIVLVPAYLERYLVWLPKFLREIVAFTVGAELFVLPLIIYYFGTVPLFGLLANVLILPAVPFLMLAATLTGFLGLFWPLAATIMGLFVQVLAGYQLAVVHWLAKLPVYSARPVIAILAAAVPVVLLVLYLKRRFYPRPLPASA